MEPFEKKKTEEELVGEVLVNKAIKNKLNAPRKEVKFTWEGLKNFVPFLETNPFGNLPPTFIKADLYLYKFNKNGPEWYKREWINIYLPPLSKNHLGLQKFILQNSWPPGP